MMYTDFFFLRVACYLFPVTCLLVPYSLFPIPCSLKPKCTSPN
ncbi:hypothetical protein [Moorena sp. SIO1F2]|nr:hypothetical protein [Moorena sp. SIO1F2]